MPYAKELSKAMTAVAELPKPSQCPFLEVDDIIPLRPEACPNDLEGCGGIRRRKQEELERNKQEEIKLDRERKDSGIGGMEDDGDVASIRSSATNRSSDDYAVSEESLVIERGLPSIDTQGLATKNKWYQEYYKLRCRGSRWRPAGPTVTYLPEYVEAGPRELKPNPRNMNLPWAVGTLSLDQFERSKRQKQCSITTPELNWIQRKQLRNPDTSVIRESGLRRSNEPDEAYLLMMEYHDIPEIREEWAEKKRRDPQPERAVVTTADATAKVFEIVDDQDE